MRGGVWKKEVLGRLFGTIGGQARAHCQCRGRINVGVKIGLEALGRFAWVGGGLEGDVRCTCLKVIRGINIHSYSGTSDLCSALIVITPPPLP